MRRDVKYNKVTIIVHRIWESVLGGKFGNFIEKAMKKPQLRYMNRLHKTVSRQPTTDVIVCDKILKFHEDDKREEFRDKFLNILNNYIDN